MSHATITSPAQLASFCEELARADRIGFDTEFVSEDTFRPELCLIQVATQDRLAVIDPYRVGELSEFWRTLADGRHTTIVHAAREEVNFALTDGGRPPANLFDTQLAAGFCSTEFPSSYGGVVEQVSRPHAGQGRAADRLASPAAHRRADRLRARRRSLSAAAARRELRTAT